MATEVKLPELGENLHKGDVVDVKVKAGDAVTAGQPLLEVEAEKSTVEVPAPFAGKISRLLVSKGQSIEVGQVLCVMEDADGAASTGPAPKPVQKEEKKERAPEQEQAASAPPTAPAAPKTKKQPQSADAKAPESAPAKAEEPAPRVAAEPTPAASQPPATGGMVAAGPATRRLARELGIDLSQVTGHGKNGRITEEDIKAHVRKMASGGTSQPTATGTAPPLPDFEKWGSVERKPLEGVRKKTAQQMSLAWNLVAHVTHNDQADITELEAFRKEQEGKGPRLTVTAFALKAAAIALKEFPQFNATLEMDRQVLILKHYYHLGVAVDTDRGLLVPVIRDVDKKSVQHLAQELSELAERARQKKLSADDMRGGTFTITNLGGIGGTSFTPIVNWPEVAILGLSRGRLQPVYREGVFHPRLLLPLSLSYDHRVIDGADAARFVRRLVEMLENPFLMLLHA